VALKAVGIKSGGQLNTGGNFIARKGSVKFKEPVTIKKAAAIL
jgi:hypothetical protein